MTTARTVLSEGIFHGLATFPDHDGKKYSAVVTGANGITGTYLVQHLAKHPERWETIYALSRKVPTWTHSHVKNISLNFLNSTPDEISKILYKNKVKAYMIELSN